MKLICYFFCVIVLSCSTDRKGSKKIAYPVQNKYFGSLSGFNRMPSDGEYPWIDSFHKEDSTVILQKNDSIIDIDLFTMGGRHTFENVKFHNAQFHYSWSTGEGHLPFHCIKYITFQGSIQNNSIIVHYGESDCPDGVLYEMIYDIRGKLKLNCQ